MDLDSLPMTMTERAELGGIASPFDAMRAAHRLDVDLPLVYLERSSGDQFRRSAWTVIAAAPSGHGREVERIRILGRDHEKTALHAAKEYAASRYGVTHWGTIPNTGRRVYYPAAVAAAVKHALKTRTSEQMQELTR